MSFSLYNYLFRTGYRAEKIIAFYRVLKHKKYKCLSKVMLLYCERSTGVELSYFAQVGKIKIAHGKNIVIGGKSIIGNNVTIYNGVTLGVSGSLYDDMGKVMQVDDYPVIEDNCIIYTGAKILGNIKIGTNSIVGANSVVISNVPPNSIVAGNPARIIKSNEYDLSKF
jgi:serine O-acetyltransferase